MVPAGAPRNLFASRDFIILHLDLVDLVGLDAALLFQRIAWRCEGRDGWPATHADLCAETRLTEHRVKQALGVLRERGWITGERADRFQPTLTWRVVWETDAVTEDFPVTSRSVAPAPVTEDFPVSTSLREQVETGKDIPQPQLAVVATDDLATDFATFWDLYPRKVGKGRAVKAYRAALKNADAATILAGLTAQLPVLRAREAAYVPHPVLGFE